MSETPAMIRQLIDHLSREGTLRGQWSFQVQAGHMRLNVAGPFVETWIRLRHAELVSTLEASGSLEFHQRSPRRKATEVPLRGDWNRFAWSQLEACRDATEGTWFVSGPAGSGKTFMTRAIFGREAQITGATSLSKRWGMACKEGNVADYEASLIGSPILILDDVQLFSSKPRIMKALRRILEARRGRPLLVLGRGGPGLEALPPEILSRFKSGLTLSLAMPDAESRRRMARDFLLESRVRLDAASLAALCSRPVTPGRLKQLVRCLRQVPQGQDGPDLIRELLRFAHADDLGTLFQHICHRHAVTPHEMHGKRRPENLVRAREDYVRMALQAGWSPREVGIMLGRTARGVAALARRSS
ncbi:MAG: hypothetical protein AB7F75_02485 [Planctomycetota bacterium]